MNSTVAEERGVPQLSLQQSVFDSLKKRRLVAALLLFTLILIIYNPASGFQFLNYDDPQYVFRNSHVQAGLTWPNVRWALTTFEFFNWHPLTWISYFTDYAPWPLQANARLVSKPGFSGNTFSSSAMLPETCRESAPAAGCGSSR